MKRRHGFTLIEMLVATVLSALLMAAVLSALTGVARDRRLLRTLRPSTAMPALDLLEWDLRNARTLSRGNNTDAVLVLLGNGGIDHASLVPDGRQVRVTYRSAGNALWRQQQYTDDPARPAPWQELVAGDFGSLTVHPSPGDLEAPVPIAARLTIDLAAGGSAGHREVVIR